MFIYRYRSRQIFGGAKDFCPNFPNFSGNSLRECFVPHGSWTPSYGITSKKSSPCDSTRWVPVFQNQTTLGAIFARVFKWFAEIFSYFANIFKNFAQIFTECARIFRNFRQIKTFAGELATRLLHHCVHSFFWCTFVTFSTTQFYLLTPLLAQRPRQPPSSPNGSAGTAPVAILRGGLGRLWLPDFGWPLFAPRVFFLTSRLSSFSWHIPGFF